MLNLKKHISVNNRHLNSLSKGYAINSCIFKYYLLVWVSILSCHVLIKIKKNKG